MKNFSELLAIDYYLEIYVNGQMSTAKLNEPLRFIADDVVNIDGFDILPRYKHLTANGMLKINQPFYNWLHQVSGQGWLLRPQ